MGKSPYGKDVEQSDADSSDESIAQRSSREMSEPIAPDLSSLTDTASSVQRTAADSVVGPQTSGPDTLGQYEQRYGVDIDTPGQADRLQRLEQSNTLPQVQRWADEGIPIDAMGTPSKMEAYRSRKRTPVPWDIEQQNEASKRRNTGAIQRKIREGPTGETQVPESVRDVVSAPGQPVDTALRKPVESEIGQSLDHARVHRSPAADAACDQLNARAFTVNNHVAVRSDQPAPDTPAGQHLMSHELTHVAQQTGGAISLLPDAGALEVDPDPKLEKEAERTARRVMQGGDLGIQRLQDTDVHVQRMQPREGTSAMQDAPNRAPEHPTAMPSSQEDVNRWNIDELIARIFGQEPAEDKRKEEDDRQRMWEEAYYIDEYSEKTDNSYDFEEAMQLLEGGNEEDDRQRTSEKTDNIHDVFAREMQLLEGGNEEDDRQRILDANDRIYKLLLEKNMRSEHIDDL